ncbi:MAG: cyclic-di-AMP receptor [Thermoflexales bacterium]|nr:cyclic-di-AMP receptor [Thermoflexales bacterium]MDW8350384.1 cyclic-di-AMP receptor [Anaerolineae bacterium]
MAVVQADDANKVTQGLNEAGYRVTRMATQGGWLRRENVTLLVGVEDAQVSDVLRILRKTAQRRMAYVNVPGEVMGAYNPQPLEVEVGGATVFVLNVERFERLADRAKD